MNCVCDKVLKKHESEPCEEVGRVRGRNRKGRDDEEGKPEKKKRRPVLDSNEHDSPEADMSRISRKRKFSADGGEEREKKRRVVEMKTLDASGVNPSGEPCEEVGRVRGRNRKGRDDEEGKPEKKKRRPVLDSNEHDSEEADMSRISRKRKFSADGGEERKKKRRVVKMKTLGASGVNPSVNLEAKYFVLGQLGAGGCGSVFAGFRKADLFPVAIKRIPQEKLFCKQVCLNGKKLPSEVAIMLKLTVKRNDSVGSSAPVSLLDWYDLGHELVVVMERPVPAIDLATHIKLKKGSLEEGKAKNIMKQLVDAAIGLQKKGVFHRDIKPENILIETGQSVPRVRLIDFGLSCLVKKDSFYSVFYGTEEYAPPEFWSSSVYRAGPSTVWQLGSVLYEMLHNQEFMTKHFLSKKLRISSGLCENLKDFLQLCLEEDPNVRPTLTELQLHPWLRETPPPNPDET